MPTPAPALSTTPGRRERARPRWRPAVVLAAVAAAGLATGAGAPAQADPTGTTTSGTTAATDVRGVIERLGVDPAPAGTRSADATAIPTTWLRTATERLAISAEAVRGIPTGSAVSVRLGPVRAGAGPHDAREVTAVTILSRASSTGTVSAGAVAHAVTAVLALPRGAKADATTAATLARSVSTGASGYWSRVSDGRITFAAATTVGWTRLTSSCTDVWGIWNEVQQRVAFVPGARRHLLVYVPTSAGCPTGLATVGASADTGGYALVGGTTAGLVAHELGHNLGLGHSDALSCTSATDAVFSSGLGSGCQRLAYGDWYDVMGISWENLGSLSTAHAQRLGLLGAGAVSTTKVPVRVTLRPVSGRAGLRSLRIQDPGGGTYVVEYRPAAGVDAWLDTKADWRGLSPGVLVRRTDPEDATQTLLLDPTPSGTAAGDTDVVLRPGETISVAAGRVSVVVESILPTAATVAVAVDGAWPVMVVEPRGRLVNGAQVTIGQALAAWGALAS